MDIVDIESIEKLMLLQDNRLAKENVLYRYKDSQNTIYHRIFTITSNQLLTHNIDDKPAVIANNKSTWYCQGLVHRTTGPAVEHKNNLKEWWLNGEFKFDSGHLRELGCIEPVNERAIHFIRDFIRKYGACRMVPEMIRDYDQINKPINKPATIKETKEVKENQMSEKKDMATTLISHSKEAAVRIAVNQGLNGSRAAILMAMAKNSSDSDGMKALEAFLKTDYGKGLLAFMLSQAVNATPILNNDARKETLVKELSIKGMELAGNNLFEDVFQFMGPMVKGLVESLPQEEALRIADEVVVKPEVVSQPVEEIVQETKKSKTV